MKFKAVKFSYLNKSKYIYSIFLEVYFQAKIFLFNQILVVV